MLSYITQRALMAIPTLFFIAVISFVIMELPPGDYLTYYIQQLEARGQRNAKEEAEALAQRYHLHDPAYVRFASWLGNFVRGPASFCSIAFSIASSWMIFAVCVVVSSDSWSSSQVGRFKAAFACPN